MEISSDGKRRKRSFNASWVPLLIKTATLGAKSAKLLLAAASFAAYALLFTWQFALVIIAMLVTHEYGHLVMMKRAGMKTKGLYLLPFIGAAAVAESDFPDRRTEAVTALAGPVTGFGLSLICALGYWATGWAFLAAVAAWGALLNLFNLLPVSPLDGGRVAKSIFFSIGTKVGMAAMIISLFLAAGLALAYQLVIFIIILPVSVIELLGERRRERKQEAPMPHLTRAGTAWFTLAYFSLAAALLGVMILMRVEPGAAAALKSLEG